LTKPKRRGKPEVVLKRKAKFYPKNEKIGSKRNYACTVAN
jgi:hypothetical protein